MNEDNPIIDKLIKDKQEKMNEDNDKIIEEFPVEIPVLKKKEVISIKKGKQKGMSSFAMNFSKLFGKKKQKPIKIIKEIEQKEQINPIEQPKELPEVKKPYPIKLNTYPTKLNTKKPKDFNKLLIPLVLVIAIIIVAFVITFKCECSQQSELDSKDISGDNLIITDRQDLIISIQNQIISKGYAEIEGSTLKLTPYTG